MYIFTWNMQGANYSTEDKWNYGVMGLLNSQDATPVMCLQECGAPPASAKLLDTINIQLISGFKDTVEVYLWGTTDTRLGYYIFFHKWDTAGNRVNTAILTDSPPENLKTGVQLVSPSGSVAWRPALGVLINGEWVFSFHAISPGGPDGADLLTEVATNYTSWIVGADWNREPANLTVPSGSIICPPDANTYSVKDPKKKYDYCVRSGTTQVTGTVIKTIVTSDHFPVGFGV